MRMNLYKLLFVLVFIPSVGSAQSIPYLEYDGTEEKELDYFNELGFVFAFGGESKLAVFLPKVNFIHYQELEKFNSYYYCYYGGELGIFPLLVAGAASISAIGGLEKGVFSLEGSFAHFRAGSFGKDMDKAIQSNVL